MKYHYFKMLKNFCNIFQAFLSRSLVQEKMIQMNVLKKENMERHNLTITIVLADVD